MKIGFISDTHGGYENTVRALEHLKGCSQIIHVGDVLYHGPRNDIPDTYDPKKLADLLKNRNDILYVRGNCDADVDETVTGQDLSKKSRIILCYPWLRGNGKRTDQKSEGVRLPGCRHGTYPCESFGEKRRDYFA